MAAYSVTVTALTIPVTLKTVRIVKTTLKIWKKKARLRLCRTVKKVSPNKEIVSAF